MNCSRFVTVGIAAAFTAAGSLAFAQAQPAAKDHPVKPAAVKAPAAPAPTAQPTQGQPPLPPGWTDADMQACTIAATPGEKQAYLAKAIGTWTGKSTMWMAPGTEPTQSASTATVTGMMDGRYTKCEFAGDMPGMGPFNGFGIYGFDNVAQQFQCMWIDNCGTGVSTGTGELAADAKTMTWKYTYNCPVTKKPTTMRQIDRVTGKDSKTMEMYGIEPKSGKEWKMMEITLTRSPGGQASAVPISNRKIEAGCANCVYHMAGAKSCALAVKVDGQYYLVKGADQVDSHQFCTAPKPVVATGNIDGDWFIATAFVVQPATR